MSREKKIFRLLIVTAICILPVVFMKYNMDTDTWFILNLGRYTLHNGFVSTDPFTMYEGLSYVFQQWLTGIYFWLIYSSFGEWGLYIAIVFESILLLLLFYKLCMYLTDNNFLVSAICTFGYSIFASVYMCTRPEILSYITAISVIFLLEKYVRTGRYTYLCIIPLLSILEINLHAGVWWLLFLFMLPFICSFNKISTFKGMDNIQFKKLPIILTALISFAVGFINPYGYKSVFYLLLSGGAKNKTRISELQPMVFTDSYGVICFITVFIVVAFMICTKILSLRYFLLAGGTLIMGMMAYRNFAYAGMGLMLYLSVLMSNAFKPKVFCHIHQISKGQQIIINLAMLTYCIVEILLSAFFIMNADSQQELKDAYTVLEYLDANSGENQNLCTDFNYGAFFEFYGYKSSIDARMELYTKRMNKKADYFDEFMDFTAGEIYYDDYLRKYDFDYIVLKTDFINGLLEHDNRYERLVDTDTYDLWIRK